MALENSNPSICRGLPPRQPHPSDNDDSVEDQIDAREVFDHVRGIRDPEHPNTLEQLSVVTVENLRVTEDSVTVFFTPTVPHCSMAALIGLSIKLRLSLSLPPRLKTQVVISPGSHSSELAVNRQLADKERVAAAFENPHLMTVIAQCLKGC